MQRLIGMFALLALLSIPAVAQEHRCASFAIEQAKKLLVFHFGEDDRIEIEPVAKVMRPVKNPAGRGSFEVLEVWGNIYKGSYRMHFLFGRVEGDCLLVGQEILEYTNL